MAVTLTLRVPRSSSPRDDLRLRIRLAYSHAMSRHGLGVMLFHDGVPLDGATFRRLRDGAGCALEAPDPDAACRALGVPEGEPGVLPNPPREDL